MRQQLTATRRGSLVLRCGDSVVVGDSHVRDTRCLHLGDVQSPFRPFPPVAICDAADDSLPHCDA
ncbi:MAG: hypothetical protein EBS41_01415 [Actinobacteria bacterium]|nr:hypothetical protein [Actinomycetota bacterium]